MGGSKLTTSQSIIDYLNELGAYAVSIGMTAEEYWRGEPSFINQYIKAESIRQKKINHQLWLQGAYIYHAIGNLVPVLNAFSKTPRANPYLKEPFPLTEEEREEQLARRIDRYMSSLVGLKPKE